MGGMADFALTPENWDEETERVIQAHEFAMDDDQETGKIRLRCRREDCRLELQCNRQGLIPPVGPAPTECPTPGWARPWYRDRREE